MKNLKNITHNFCNNNKKAASMFKLTHDFSQSMDLFYTFKPFCKHNKTKKSVIWFWFRNLHFQWSFFVHIFNEKNGNITYKSIPLCQFPMSTPTNCQSAKLSHFWNNSPPPGFEPGPHHSVAHCTIHYTTGILL